MTSRFALAAALLAVSGCITTMTEMSPEAEPFAEQAIRSAQAVEVYLTASGARVVYTESEPDLAMMHVTRRTLMEFEERGGCVILTYKSAEGAEQYGPRSGGGPTYVRRDATGPALDTVRRSYKPTYRFGPMVAVCFDEPTRAANALANLQAYAQERS